MIFKTEDEVRAAIVKRAESWIGSKENDGSHKPIIDLYNSYTPLPVGYKMKYTDPWCAAFGSVVAIEENFTDIIPPECSCSRQIALFKKLNCWVEDDKYIPKPADYIYYDWQDSGIGDNIGDPDHVGIVVSNTNNTIKVIEGNIRDSVGYRYININGKYIRGYGTPNYASKVTKEEEKPSQQEEVYVVKKGDTLSSIAKQFNTTYQKIAEYNNLKNINLIYPGQKLRIPPKEPSIVLGPGYTVIKNPYSMPIVNISIGSHDQGVKWAQFALYKAGYGFGDLGSFVSGVFDDKTMNAVIKFQVVNHLPANGIIDTATRNALKKVTQ